MWETAAAHTPKIHLSKDPPAMRLDDLVRAFWDRPVYQRVFLAFTVGVFLACSARMAEANAKRPMGVGGLLSDSVPAAASVTGGPSASAPPRS